MALIPCPACQRHVYTTEVTCPFCSHELGTSQALPARRLPMKRMSRAALVVLGMSSVACGGDAEESGNTSDDAGVDGTANAVYGSPAIGITTTGSSTSVAIPIYGAPATGGDVGAGGAPTGGTGGTGGADNGGAAGEANDTSPGGAAGEANTNRGGAAGEANGS